MTDLTAGQKYKLRRAFERHVAEGHSARTAWEIAMEEVDVDITFTHMMILANNHRRARGLPPHPRTKPQAWWLS